MKDQDGWFEEWIVLILAVSVILLMTSCSQHSPPQPGAGPTTIEYEYKGKPISRQQLQRIEDREFKKTMEMNR